MSIYVKYFVKINHRLTNFLIFWRPPCIFIFLESDVQSRSTPTSGPPPPKVSARAPAHRSYHFRGVKLKSCIKKIHHNLYISKQANVRIKHADTEGASHKNIRHRCQSSVGHLCRHCETKAMTLKSMKKL